MKWSQIPKHADNSNKQNINPNIQILSTQQQTRLEPHSSKYPKVSMFRPVLVEQQESKDWRKRILYLSEREWMLNNRLTRMLEGAKTSPVKLDKAIVMTEAASSCKYSQKQLGNTLRRYLYERSNQNTASMMQGYNIINTQLNSNMIQIVQQIHKVSQQITGVQIPVLNTNNPQQILGCVLDALKEYKHTTGIVAKDKFREKHMGDKENYLGFEAVPNNVIQQELINMNMNL